MSYPKPPVPCPFCKELIHPEAKRCKHCHAETSVPKPKTPPLVTKLNTFRVGLYTGIGISLLIAFLIYWIVSR